MKEEARRKRERGKKGRRGKGANEGEARDARKGEREGKKEWGRFCYTIYSLTSPVLMNAKVNEQKRVMDGQIKNKVNVKYDSLD